MINSNIFLKLLYLLLLHYKANILYAKDLINFCRARVNKKFTIFCVLIKIPCNRSVYFHQVYFQISFEVFSKIVHVITSSVKLRMLHISYESLAFLSKNRSPQNFTKNPPEFLKVQIVEIFP